jgi:hypothetical protein
LSVVHSGLKGIGRCPYCLSTKHLDTAVKLGELKCGCGEFLRRSVPEFGVAEVVGSEEKIVVIALAMFVVFALILEALKDNPGEEAKQRSDERRKPSGHSPSMLFPEAMRR